jgi:aminocarboxymuconate-semialdehyde decarboxylase
MGFDPAVVRFAVDVLGPEHVLVGSDWPIVWRDPSRARVVETLAAAGAPRPDRELIASGNARRLLRLPLPALA